jgi:hypothetical protein
MDNKWDSGFFRHIVLTGIRYRVIGIIPPNTSTIGKVSTQTILKTFAFFAGKFKNGYVIGVIYFQP